MIPNQCRVQKVLVSRFHGFNDVVIGGNAEAVGNFGKYPAVLHILLGNIDAKEGSLTIFFFPFYQIFKLRFYARELFWNTLIALNSIHSILIRLV
jgi:hypothetical protein